MYQTLFHIPHFLFQGWLLAVWLVAGALFVAWSCRKHGFGREALNTIIFVIIGALLIHFVLPFVEAKVPDPTDPTGERLIAEGLAIRGYGLMFWLGAILGVGIAWYRGVQMGIEGDRILELSFYMFITGIIGARLFYVIQYRDQFIEDGKFDWASVVNMTEGGLVVYGSVIGGLLAAFVFTRLHAPPAFAIADIIAPGMVLGLALGRLGCLLNGCCFGGQCEWPVALNFPAGSPPYMRQFDSGQLIGIEGHRESDESGWFRLDRVEPGSFADQHGLRAGQDVFIHGVSPDFVRKAHVDERYDRLTKIDVRSDRAGVEFRLSELPRYSLPVHPTQIYSAINAALICFLLWMLYPFRRNDGEVIAAMLMLYGVARFVLEGVRVDEPEQFGTGLTISQIVSIGTFSVGLAILLWARLRHVGLALPQPDPSGPAPNRPPVKNTTA